MKTMSVELCGRCMQPHSGVEKQTEDGAEFVVCPNHNKRIYLNRVNLDSSVMIVQCLTENKWRDE